MAQFGSALDWGSRGRRFKSCQPDQLLEQVIGIGYPGDLFCILRSMASDTPNSGATARIRASCWDGEMLCAIGASVVQSKTNGAPPTRAALVPYLSRFTLAGVTGFFTFKAVRHSLLAKLTIPITTVRSAHTAIIVWVSIGFSDQIEAARATKHRDHCSARGAQAASRRAGMQTCGWRVQASFIRIASE